MPTNNIKDIDVSYIVIRLQEREEFNDWLEQLKNNKCNIRSTLLILGASSYVLIALFALVNRSRDKEGIEEVIHEKTTKVDSENRHRATSIPMATVWVCIRKKTFWKALRKDLTI